MLEHLGGQARDPSANDQYPTGPRMLQQKKMHCYLVGILVLRGEKEHAVLVEGNLI